MPWAKHKTSCPRPPRLRRPTPAPASTPATRDLQTTTITHTAHRTTHLLKRCVLLLLLSLSLSLSLYVCVCACDLLCTMNQQQPLNFIFSSVISLSCMCSGGLERGGAGENRGAPARPDHVCVSRGLSSAAVHPPRHPLSGAVQVPSPVRSRPGRQTHEGLSFLPSSPLSDYSSSLYMP